MNSSCRHIQDSSASSSILTRSFPSTPKRSWSDIRASNAMKFRRMFLPSPTPHIDPCCKVNEIFRRRAMWRIVLWWGGKKSQFCCLTRKSSPNQSSFHRNWKHVVASINQLFAISIAHTFGNSAVFEVIFLLLLKGGDGKKSPRERKEKQNTFNYVDDLKSIYSDYSEWTKKKKKRIELSLSCLSWERLQQGKRGRAKAPEW